MPTVDNLDIQISTSLKNTDKMLDNLIKKLGVVSSSLSRVGGTTSNVSNGMTRVATSATRSTKSFNGLAAAFGRFYANYFLVVRGIKALYKSIEGTADYIEAFNYFEVSFNKIASEWKQDYKKFGYDNAEAYEESFNKRAKESLSKLSGVQIDIDADGKGLLTETGMKNLGLNIQEITQYASQLASVTNSVGQTGEVSLAAANSFTKLAGDISSLFNQDYSAVAKNLQSGLIGQSRALYKYGIDITNATLQTYAFKLGLEKEVAEMTQAEKMQLRMIAILDQSKVSWGDLANTIDSPSNMIRQFKNNLKEAGMVLGQLFVPLLSKVLPVINGITIAIKRLLVNIAGFLGIELDLSSFGQGGVEIEDTFDDVSDSLDNVADSAKKAKAGLRGFDELKTINMPKSSKKDSGGLGGAIDLTDEILKATSEYEKVWNKAYEQMENKAQAFADSISKYLEPVEKLFKDISIGDWFAVGEDVSNIVSGIFNFFADAIDKVDWYGIGNDIGDFLEGLDWTKILSSLGRLIWEGISGAIELWKGSFDAAPIETTIITAVALLSWTGLGAAIWKSISTALASSLAAKFGFKIAAGTTLGAAIKTGAGTILKSFISSLGTAFVSGGANFVDSPGFAAIANFILGGIDKVIEDLLPAWARKLIGNIIAGISSGGITGSIIPGVGTLAGAIIGGIIGALETIKIDGKGIATAILNPIFNFDWATETFKKAGKAFSSIKKAFEKRDWLGIGANILKGIGNGIYGSLIFLVEPILDLFDVLIKAICKIFGIHSPAKKMEPYGKNILLGIIEGFKNSFSEMPKAIKKFFKEYVSPWFTKEKWSEQIGSIKNALKEKWKQAGEWWKSKSDLKQIKPSISNFVDTLKNAWQKAKQWWKENVKLTIPKLEFKLEYRKAKNTLEKAVVSALDLDGWPTFKFFANGGFPEDGWFRANHGEIMGKFDNGQSVVANNMQITKGISEAVYKGNQENNNLLRQEIALLQKQNELLTGILQKEYGITDSDIGKSAQRYARNYFNRTGKEAYSF